MPKKGCKTVEEQKNDSSETVHKMKTSLKSFNEETRVINP